MKQLFSDAPERRRYRGRALGLCFLATTVFVAACSIDNIEGPEVTCAELACGRYNACLNGIIAQCLDGKNVRYFVCNEDGEDVCDAAWQNPGAYRCEQTQTDCEGCRPERTEGCNGTSAP